MHSKLDQKNFNYSVEIVRTEFNVKNGAVPKDYNVCEDPLNVTVYSECQYFKDNIVPMLDLSTTQITNYSFNGEQMLIAFYHVKLDMLDSKNMQNSEHLLTLCFVYK